MSEYFEGWYIKEKTNNGNIILIPYICKNKKSQKGGLQLICENTVYSFVSDNCNFDRLNEILSIDKSVFTKDGFMLNISNDKLCIVGSISFYSPQKLKNDIMGPFRFIKHMECSHSVFHMSHKAAGKLTVNGKEYAFNGQKGYFEGDRGKSFPKKYAWTQGQCENADVMIAAAEIPLFGSSFFGTIAAVKTPKKEYIFATYNGAKAISASDEELSIKKGNYVLTAKRLSGESVELLSPKNGNMTESIYEYPCCTVRFTLKLCGIVILEFTDDFSGYEFF